MLAGAVRGSPRRVHVYSTSRCEDGEQAQANVLRSAIKPSVRRQQMNEKSGHRGPSRALLLLIPAALILAKGARHRRARWESTWGPSGAGGEAGHGFGRRAGFGGG